MRQVAALSRVVETATYLGVPVERLEDVIERGRLPIVPVTSEMLIHEADLEAFLAGFGDPFADALEREVSVQARLRAALKLVTRG